MIRNTVCDSLRSETMFLPINSNKCAKGFISPVLVILFLIYLQVFAVTGQHRGDEICETLPSEIHLIKGKQLLFFGIFH